MNFVKYAFPQPILGRSDDVAGKTDVDLAIDEETDQNRFVVSLKYLVENADIQQMIADGRAEFYCEITCSATLFRSVVTGDEAIQVFTIEKSVVRGKVDFLFLVVTSDSVRGYLNSEVNEELAGLATDLDRGDVLAFLGTAGFLADIAFKKLKAASSFLEIVEGTREHGPFEVVLDNPKILVRLSRADYATYTKPEVGRNEKLASVFQSAVAFPALTNALQQLASADGAAEYGERAWAKAMSWRLENEPEFVGKSLDPENVLEIAQIMLGDPVERLLSDVQAADDAETEDEA